MTELTLQDLLEAGAHFGHQTKRWNPKMKRYILCARNGVYIVDLEKTLTGLNAFLARVRQEVAGGGKVLFVGTKKQIKDCIREEAERCGMPYVTERWLGGMLTNFQTIRQSIRKLDKIESMESDGTMEALPKKEALSLGKKKDKLVSVLGGIRHMRKTPSLIFVVDTIKEHIAVAESRRLGIPIGAIVDTNCDPEEIDFVIPGNDDALKSVQLITKTVTDAVLEASPSLGVEDKDRAEALAGEAKAGEGAEVSEEAAAEPESEDAGAKARKRRVVHRKIAETPDEE